MAKPGPLNLITDIDGLTVGNATDENVQTGVTVLRCAQSFTAAVDVRGGAPGVRETDTLAPENLVSHADAFVLTGGSVFGLAAADGVTSFLSEKNIGLRIGDKGPAIPIVPSAVLHDLANDGDKNWGETPPYRQLGMKAANDAAKEFQLGAVGAGRGAKAGALPGGLGSASVVLDDGIVVGALVAANPVGSVVMSDGKTFYAWPFECDGEFGNQPPPSQKDGPEPFLAKSRLGQNPQPGANTTIALVATSAALTNVETKRMAMMAHDGIARAVRPAHTTFDGDTVFSVSTGAAAVPDNPMARAASVAIIGAAASDCLARAIARAVYEAA